MQSLFCCTVCLLQRESPLVLVNQTLRTCMYCYNQFFGHACRIHNCDLVTHRECIAPGGAADPGPRARTAKYTQGSPRSHSTLSESLPDSRPQKKRGLLPEAAELPASAGGAAANSSTSTYDHLCGMPAAYQQATQSSCPSSCQARQAPVLTQPVRTQVGSGWRIQAGCSSAAASSSLAFCEQARRHSRRAATPRVRRASSWRR